MKTLRTFTMIMSLGAVLSTAPAFALMGSRADIEKFNLKVCTQNQNKCLEINADKAKGSQFAAIFAFDKVLVNWSEKQKPTEVISYSGGHFDLAMNRVVLIGSDNGVSTETVISLNTLDIQKFTLE